ncbi:hypothetical protein [Rhizobium sp. BK176]|uniref:hypothetical protein n=1 Tax=Rhizobium sp. BK176 TaxID=2587071 RepID=UPI002168FAC4|nr:hypothetical protein [Rhizobium sp. BK176]MCS4089172.1 hypothetical protein [Rhizobium sp. BK176]
MTSLSRFIARQSDDDVKMIVAVSTIVIVGGLWVYSGIRQSLIHDESILAQPLNGSSVSEFIDTLDQKPDGRVDSLTLNKAADRFMADMIETSMLALSANKGELRVPTEQEMAKNKLDPRRYDAVRDMELTIRTKGKFHWSVKKYGPQAAEKLDAVKQAVTNFEKMVTALKVADIGTAKAELVELQDALHDYLLKFHSREEYMDRASSDLRFLEREFDAINKSVAAAAIPQTAVPK